MREPRQIDLDKALEIQGLQRQAALRAASEASELETRARSDQDEACQDRDGLIDFWTQRLEQGAPDPGMIANFSHVLAARNNAVHEAEKVLEDAQSRTQAERVRLAHCEARQRATFRQTKKLRRQSRKRKEEKALLLLELQIGARQ